VKITTTRPLQPLCVSVGGAKGGMVWWMKYVHRIEV
jgi:hypothetical protein